MPVRRLVFALCVAIAPVVSFAQGVFDMGMLTNTMAQGAIVKSERDRAARTGRTNTKGTRVRAKANPAIVLYRPNLAARKRNFDRFVARITAVDPQSAQGMRQAASKGDLIAQAGPLMRGIGMNPNNVADAMAMYLVAAWHGSRGEDNATKAEFRAVSAQLSRAVAANPAMLRVSDAVKQETAESMILSALLVDASVTAAMKDRSQLPGVKANLAQGARRTFGFDLAKLRLGANGFF